MMSTIRSAGLALLAMTVVARACFAQEVALPAAPDSVARVAPAAPTDSIARPAPHPLTPGNTPGRSAIGGFVGGSWFYAADDYSQGALPRFDFAGHWRYTFTSHFRTQLSVGFTWSAYAKQEAPPYTDPAFPAQTTKEGYLTQLIPSSLQGQWMWTQGKTLWHVGLGPNVTRVMVQNQRKVLKDSVTFALHRTFHLGVTGEVGVERFLKTLSHTSVEVALTTHYIFASNDELFPAGFNSAVAPLCLRVGANYYFDAAILKKKQSAPLPKSSGKK